MTREAWLTAVLRGRVGRYTQVRLGGVKDELFGFVREVDESGGVRMETRPQQRGETADFIVFFVGDVAYISGQVEKSEETKPA